MTDVRAEGARRVLDRLKIAEGLAQPGTYEYDLYVKQALMSELAAIRLLLQDIAGIPLTLNPSVPAHQEQS